MRYTAVFLCSTALLSGCMKAQDSSVRVLDDVQTGTSTAWDKMRDTLDLNSKPTPKNGKPPETRYCYRTYEDIICYNKPIEGQEDRLLAYQDGHYTGYTIEPLPKPHATPKPKAVAKVTQETPATATKPGTKVTTTVSTVTEDGKLAPVTVPLPGAVAGVSGTPVPTPVPTSQPDDQKHLKEITFDPSELEPKKLVPDKIQ